MINKEHIADKFDHLYQEISQEGFRRGDSLGGEIPFHISSYHPEQETEVGPAIDALVRKLSSEGLKVKVFNLYDLMIDILNEELGEGVIFELEKEMSRDELKDAIQSTLDISEVLIPRIAAQVKEAAADVYFLTGIGLVYPIIRSHNILNNLHHIITEAPLIAFFPGEYNGESLELFGLLKDDNYYRAFMIKQA
jgi:hypothetical protein